MPDAFPKRKIELIAIDLDGTLLREDKQVTRRTVQTIREVQKSGVHVVIATARPPRGMRYLAEALQIDSYWITYNGALVVNPKTNKNVLHQPLASAMVRKMIKLARKTDPKCVISLEILDKWYTDYVDDSLPTEISRQFAPDFVGPLDAFLHVPVTKLLVLAPPERIDKLRKALDSKFAGQMMSAITDDHLLQYIHKDADKSKALTYVANQYNIAPENCMAIGDAPNDVSMIRWAGLGVAMKSGWEIIHKHADIIAPSNDDDGVAHVIQKYVLDVQ